MSNWSDLADWLKHMQETNKTLAHIPEMAEHIDNLKKWEAMVRERSWEVSHSQYLGHAPTPHT